MAETLTQEVSALLGYDRTMLYQFEEDYSGQVIAERLGNDDLEPFLHLHYPETDIPECARLIYLRQHLRMICNSSDVPVALYPQKPNESSERLDLTHCILRSPSQCHCMYLRHMKVSAALSYGIVVEGKLWGLMICYHSTPKYQDYNQRAGFELLCQAASILMQTKLQHETKQYETKWKQLQAKLFEILASQRNIEDGLFHQTPLMDLIPCCGACVVHDSAVITMGICPEKPQIVELVVWLSANTTEDVWCTDSLGRSFDFAHNIQPFASGLMAARISRKSCFFILWFRPELVFTVAWGGDYHEAIDIGPEGRLGPRSSFTQYREEIRGRSERWTASDLAAARLLRNTFVEVMSSKAGELSLQSEVLSTLNEKLEVTNQQLKRSANELHQLIRTVPVSIIGLDHSGIVQEWNPMAERETGFSQTDILGLKFVHTVVDPPYKPVVQDMIEKALRGERTAEVEIRVRHRTSTQYMDWALQVAPRIDTNRAIIGVVAVGLDITERKAMLQAQLRVANYAAANDAKSRFLATISHEMRTPLNGVLGMLQLAMECDLSATARDYVDKAYLSGEHLLALISDILDLSLIEAGKIEIKVVPFNVRYLVDSVISMVSSRAEARNLKICANVSKDFPHWVGGDPDRIKQVLINLCVNAIKYSEHGQIHVNCTVNGTDSRTEHLLVRVEVVDQGIGIRKEDLAVLFTMFTRLRNDQRKDPGGTGLGLNICKHLVDRMGGDIGAESQHEVGSTFWFVLPLKPESPPEASVEPDCITSPGVVMTPPLKASILLVDDNEFNLQVAKAMLAAAGHTVDTATTGAEGVRWYSAKVKASTGSCSYDIILMDCEMPEMDGYQAAKAIRRIEASLRLRRVPVVALTAHAMKDHSAKCYDSGMDDYLTKPIHKKTLLEMVGRYAQAKHAPLPCFDLASDRPIVPKTSPRGGPPAPSTVTAPITTTTSTLAPAFPLPAILALSTTSTTPSPTATPTPPLSSSASNPTRSVLADSAAVPGPSALFRRQCGDLQAPLLTHCALSPSCADSNPTGDCSHYRTPTPTEALAGSTAGSSVTALSLLTGMRARPLATEGAGKATGFVGARECTNPGTQCEADSMQLEPVHESRPPASPRRLIEPSSESPSDSKEVDLHFVSHKRKLND